MYYLQKTVTIAACHRLELPYDSPCQNTHGHNWKITVYCRSVDLSREGMVIDFKKIKEMVMKYDHANLNDFFEQPTAENMAREIYEDIPYCYRVDIEESPGAIVSYVFEE